MPRSRKQRKIRLKARKKAKAQYVSQMARAIVNDGEFAPGDIVVCNIEVLAVRGGALRSVTMKRIGRVVRFIADHYPPQYRVRAYMIDELGRMDDYLILVHKDGMRHAPMRNVDEKTLAKMNVRFLGGEAEHHDDEDQRQSK